MLLSRRFGFFSITRLETDEFKVSVISSGKKLKISLLLILTD